MSIDMQSDSEFEGMVSASDHIMHHSGGRSKVTALMVIKSAGWNFQT